MRIQRVPIDILTRIYTRISASKHKRYDDAAWQRNVPPDVLQACYDAQQWSGIDGAWRKRNVDRLSARISELHVASSDRITILDVACFSGDYFGKLSEQDELEGNFHYTGIDVTPAYIDAARIRWRGSAASFQVGSAKSLPFDDGTFDIAFNSGMLIHMDDPARCIRELLRVARRFALIETTTNRSLFTNFIEEDKSGPNFLDRVYRDDFIRELIASAASIVYESSVPYGDHDSTLFEVALRQA